jgi:hypothetical protein
MSVGSKAVRPLYSVINENGTLIHGVETVCHGERAIAREFGIYSGELVKFRAKPRHSKSLVAYLFRDIFREIVGARRCD